MRDRKVTRRDRAIAQIIARGKRRADASSGDTFFRVA